MIAPRAICSISSVRQRRDRREDMFARDTGPPSWGGLRVSGAQIALCRAELRLSAGYADLARDGKKDEEMTTPEDPMATRMRVRVEAEKAQAALYSAKPTISLLHHMAAVQAIQPIGFTVTLADGTAYRAEGVDHIFTDGLSVVVEGHRRYFPLTAIREIVMQNPGESS